MADNKIKILLKSFAVFLITGFFMFIALHWILPILLENGWIFAKAYILCFYTPLAFCFTLSIILYIREGNDLAWKNFACRMRLKRLSKVDVLWSIGLTIFLLAGYMIILQPMGAFIEKNFLHAGDFFPPGLHPNKPAIAGEMFGLKLSGQWWFAGLYLIGWFFNIAGEELLFRGFLLPKEEEVFGNKAWLYQGVIWAFWHSFWYWNVLPYLLVITVPLLFVVARQKNTWIGIIVHGLVNLFPLIMIIVGILS